MTAATVRPASSTSRDTAIVLSTTVLGLVGAGGIGLLIDAVRTFYRYDQLSLIIVEILVIVVVLDTVSDAIRRRLV